MKIVVQNLFGTTRDWNRNPVLYNAVWGIEETADGKRFFKLGNGRERWNDLEYFDIENIRSLPDELQRTLEEAKAYAHQCFDGIAAGPQGPQGERGLQGEQGTQGIEGPQGQQGPIGPTGPQGTEGPQGQLGPEGPSGPRGLSGEPGPTGATGATGAQGPAGLQGEPGSPGPAGRDGAGISIKGSFNTKEELLATIINPDPGDAFMVLEDVPENNGLYLWNNAKKQFVNKGNIRGPQGPQGVQGSQGPAGPVGPTGSQGPQGEHGAAGPAGATGPQGPQGEQGVAGAAGATGPQGQQGTQGPAPVMTVAATNTGEVGSNAAVSINNNAFTFTIPRGVTGPGFTFRGAWEGTVAYSTNDVVTLGGHTFVCKGSHGADASRPPTTIGELGGSSGTAGFRWALWARRGNDGANGANGANGATGPQGPQGERGAAGATGATGPQGPQGNSASPRYLHSVRLFMGAGANAGFYITFSIIHRNSTPMGSPTMFEQIAEAIRSAGAFTNSTSHIPASGYIGIGRPFSAGAFVHGIRAADSSSSVLRVLVTRGFTVFNDAGSISTEDIELRINANGSSGPAPSASSVVTQIV